MQSIATQQPNWHFICYQSDLILNSGICALVDNIQVAVFALETNEGLQLFATSNWDPIGQANVMYRGLIGSLENEIVIASPIYKEHYSLTTGRCLEHEDQSIAVYQVRLSEDKLYLSFD